MEFNLWSRGKWKNYLHSQKCQVEIFRSYILWGRTLKSEWRSTALETNTKLKVQFRNNNVLLFRYEKHIKALAYFLKLI